MGASEKAPADTKKIPLLDDLEHRSVDEFDFKQRLREQQLKLLQLQFKLSESRQSLIIIFEGPDAAGKGGVIKRLAERLDPRQMSVYSIIKPTADELQHHYLWRFWIKLPPAGKIAVFDRSWYGRVLVERVEGFATDAEWKRASREINEFERLLTDDGTVIMKFYLHITKEEQLSRFRRREADPYKCWKISDEDWRNRKKWDEHNKAAQDMFEQTSTTAVPWHVIGANYKWYARLKVVKTVVARLESAVK